jgi:spore maturation protein CgeB
MPKDEIQKPDSVDEQIWEENQRWIKLMAAQAEIHRKNRDPRLYRVSNRKKLISPLLDTNNLGSDD